jgi:PDZ domain-containing protein
MKRLPFHLTNWPKISLSVTWLVAAPVGLWAVATIYVPIFAALLSPAQTWAATALIGVCVALSVAWHALAHGMAARALRGETPARVSIYPFGDAAQAWPAASPAWREVLAATAGPLASLALAGIAYWLWDAHLNLYLNLATLFVCGFNLWLAVVNLAPAFPLDGGRVAAVLLGSVMVSPTAAARLAVRFGYAIAVALGGWGIFLIAQRSRFSWPTGLATIFFAGLIALALRRPPARNSEAVPSARPGGWPRLARAALAGLLMLTLLAVSGSLVLMNNGLEAPGAAEAVEPMVQVAPSHAYTAAGSFILTTVIVQTPILAGERLAAQFDPAYKIVSPADIVPPDTTPQQLAQQGYRQLDQSETAAIVAGLRQAGFAAGVVGHGAEVLSILPDSLAQGQLQVGDVITGLDGTQVQTTDDLIGLIRQQPPGATVRLTVMRGQATVEVDVPLMPAADPNSPPRLGISIQPAGFDLSLPFPVTITAQKIVGGPSAGLMFALTVYNAVTPDDLTGGRRIAGTGTIDLSGAVGPIGGVEQKVAAAEAAGATYFLSPAENYDAARSVARHIQVVKVTSLQEAVDFLHSLPPQ